MNKALLLLAVPLLPIAGGCAADLSSRARGNLAEVVSDADYPDSAIRAEEQGIVGYDLKVGTDGRVTGCVITSSSGSAALDETTCRIMTARMQFTPARDRKGRPVADIVHARLRWVIPADPDH
jgi:protein TonB